MKISQNFVAFSEYMNFNALKAIYYGVAFAKILRAKSIIFVENGIYNMCCQTWRRLVYGYWLLVILNFEFYNPWDLTIWIFSIDYLLIGNLDGVTSQAYFIRIVFIFVMQPNHINHYSGLRLIFFKNLRVWIHIQMSNDIILK